MEVRSYVGLLNCIKWPQFSANYFVKYRVASGNSYKNEFIKLATLSFSFEFSNDGATIVFKLSLRSFRSICIINLRSI